MTSKTIPPSKTKAYSRRYDKLRRNGYRLTVDGTITRRKLAALQRLGYSLTWIAGNVNRTQQSLSQTFHSDAPVHWSTAKAVDVLYKKLHMTPAFGPGANRVRLRAERLGYLSSLAWDDITDITEEPKQ